ncbi:MAG: 4Fe-4S dicluster domain-containing protein [Pseudomonadota bacterium]
MRRMIKFIETLPFTGKGLILGRFIDGEYQPPLIHRLLKPRLDGNALNGLGETEHRRVGKIYHWVGEGPRGYPWFWVNVTFAIRTVREKTLGYGALTQEMLNMAETTDKANEAPLQRGIEPPTHSPSKWAVILKAKAREFGAKDVGICRVTEDMLYEGRPSPGKYVLMIAAPMQYELARHIPEVKGLQATMHGYINANVTSLKLMHWLRDQGIYCESGSGKPDKLVLIPAAIKAGIGQLGKHGSLISPTMGSLVRFSYVSFDLEVVVDGPVDFGSEDFCTHCQICTQYCPPEAISDRKQQVRGVEKWYVDFDKCVPYFNDTLGCGICISVCPWSNPETRPILAPKMEIYKKKKDNLRDVISIRQSE